MDCTTRGLHRESLKGSPYGRAATTKTTTSINTSTITSNTNTNIFPISSLARYEDEEFVESRMNHLPYRAGKFALGLRLQLFREFLDVAEGRLWI